MYSHPNFTAQHRAIFTNELERRRKSRNRNALLALACFSMLAGLFFVGYGWAL